MAGFEGVLSLGAGVAKRTYDDTSNWNPLLIAIAHKQFKTVEALFEKIPSFHALNCLAKPYHLKV